MSDLHQEETHHTDPVHEGRTELHNNQSQDFVKVEETINPVLTETNKILADSQRSSEQEELGASHVLVESQKENEPKVGSLTKVDDLFKSQDNFVYHPPAEKPFNVDSISSLEHHEPENTTTDTTQDETTLASRIAKATALKNTAKPFVKGGLYEDAIKIYESAFYTLKPTAEDRSSGDFKKAQTLQNEIFNNLSLCHSKLDRNQDAISYAQKVLLSDKDNVKALYRLAVCYKNLGDFTAAYEEIEKCQEAFRNQNPDKPLDPTIRELAVTLKDRCRTILEEREKKEKEMYARMMGSQTSDKQKVQEEGRTSEIVYHSENKEPVQPKKSIFAHKAVRFGIGLGLTGLIGYSLYRIARRRAEQEVRRVLPGLILAVGAFVCLKYVRGHVRSSLFGLGMGVGATLLLQRANRKNEWI